MATKWRRAAKNGKTGGVYYQRYKKYSSTRIQEKCKDMFFYYVFKTPFISNTKFYLNEPGFSAAKIHIFSKHS